jgi:hypothetical protein
VTKEREAPEVHAARREAGLRSHPITAVSQTEFTGLSFVSLVTEMDAASKVDILGVLPRTLGEALLAADVTENQARSASDFTYMTPSRERVSAYRHENVMGRVIQRWQAGITCFMNWTEKHHARHVGQPDNVYLIDDLFLECLVVCHGEAGGSKVYALNLLPQVGDAGVPGSAPHESLVITEVTDSAVDRVLARIAALRAEATPLVERGLVCANGRSPEQEPRPNRTDGLLEEFVPVLTDLRRYGSRPPYAIGPVTVVALYADSARGPGLLLKHRTNSNSHNDLGTLSLLSERVMEEDLALAISEGVPSSATERDVLDHWWKTMGKPERIEVPRPAFIAAGQREVFVATGLDVASSRFTYCGSILVEREGTEELLGFLGFRVDLIRDHEIDELARATRWNADLEFVLASELYGRGEPSSAAIPNRPPLNRLLSRRPEWVSSVLLADRSRDRRDAPDGE